MNFTIFSYTTVTLSKEAMEKFGVCPRISESDPELAEGYLNKICLENDVKSTLTNDDRFILEGDWSAMVTVYNSIVKFLKSNFNIKQGVLTYCTDLFHFVDDLNGCTESKSSPDVHVINSVDKQSKTKIPDPIVYSFNADVFCNSSHHKEENINQTNLELMETSEIDNLEENFKIKQELKDVIVLTQDENSMEEDVVKNGINNIHETRTRTRRRKCQSPKKTLITQSIKRQTNKKSNVENGQDKKNQKKPSSLKPKKSWSQKILQDQNIEISEHKGESLVDSKPDWSTSEKETESVSNKELEIVAENENKNEMDDDWTLESAKKDYFQVKDNKALKLTLKKNQRSTRFSNRRKKATAASSRSEHDATDTKAVLDQTEENCFNCPMCSYFAKKKANLREHVQRMHDDKIWECEFCGKTFSIQKDLVRHEKSHGSPQLCCDFCGKMYKSRRTFLQHKKSHEENYIKPEYECKICQKSFSTKYVLNYHVKSEHKGIKKQFLCPTCGKSFTQKNSYIQHANVHMGVKPYQCEHCGKSFAYEKSLKEHRYMHDEILHFKCDVCSKHFRQKSALQIHRKIHQETKDHLCGVCGKGFTQRQALIRHERIHNGDKPFKCGICSRTFSDASIIRRHMILVHKKDTKEWREDVICDLKGADDYWIEGKKPEGRIKRLPTSKKTTNEPEEEKPSVSVDKEITENKTDVIITSTEVGNEIGEIVNHFNPPSTVENNVLNNTFEQSPCEGEFMTHSLYNDEQMMKETSIYLRKNPPLLQPNADGSENNVMLNPSISQFLSNPHITTETSTTVNLDHTFNETFTNIHDRKSEERLTNPFQANTHIRSAGNQWTAEPYSYNTINYISQFQNYPNH